MVTGRIDEAQSVSRVRFLVVDDFEPYRRFVCSTVGQRPDLQVIGEASDGLEAVQKAGELQPDLILLDIGLPRLNGIEAARQIRKLVPESKPDILVLAGTFLITPFGTGIGILSSDAGTKGGRDAEIKASRGQV